MFRSKPHSRDDTLGEHNLTHRDIDVVIPLDLLFHGLTCRYIRGINSEFFFYRVSENLFKLRAYRVVLVSKPKRNNILRVSVPFGTSNTEPALDCWFIKRASHIITYS